MARSCPLEHVQTQNVAAVWNNNNALFKTKRVAFTIALNLGLSRGGGRGLGDRVTITEPPSPFDCESQLPRGRSKRTTNPSLYVSRAKETRSEAAPATRHTENQPPALLPLPPPPSPPPPPPQEKHQLPVPPRSRSYGRHAAPRGQPLPRRQQRPQRRWTRYHAQAATVGAGGHQRRLRVGKPQQLAGM